MVSNEHFISGLADRPTNRSTFRRGALLPGLLLWGLIVLPARAAGPLDLIPAETLACWSSTPLPDAPPAGDPGSALSTLVDVGTRLVGAKLDRSTQITLRLAEALSQSVRYPTAIAFLDVGARAATLDPQGRKLERFQVVAVVQCGSAVESFRKIIQKIINEQTDQANATLTSNEAGGFRYQELRDKRKEDLGAIAWGQIDDCFVIALGDGLWARVAQVGAKKAPALAADKWVRSVRNLDEHPSIEIFAAFQTIAQKLDPILDQRASQFLKAWDVAGTRRAWWSLGFDGRAMFAHAAFEDGEGRTQTRRFADSRVASDMVKAVVPNRAQFAVFDLPAGLALQRAISGWYAFCDAKTCQTADRRWQKIVAETKVDPQRDILARLGPRLIFHNDPPHPLHLPLAFTTLIEIREAAALRTALDRVLTAWQAAAEDQEAGTPELVQLRHDSDGIWYIELGPVAGIAWISTDRYLVASWSPQALRQYLTDAGDAVGKRQ